MTKAALQRGGTRSKSLATWTALLGGVFGLHRFYLHGRADAAGWLFPLPTLIGAYGFWRMRHFGIDDRIGSWLVPLLGASFAAACLSAIVIGLTSADRWRARWHRSGSGDWPTVIGVILALALGATVTMATIAFLAQSYFEANRG